MATKFDYGRAERIGMPEAILCEGKDSESLARLLQELLRRPDHPVMLTRLTADHRSDLPETITEKLDYDPISQTAYLNGRIVRRRGRVAVVSAGTADLRVALEAHRTLEFMGITSTVISDVGIAGMWRLLERLDEVKICDVVIAVAGMDAALPTVLGGLIGLPIIAVPTSIGYGVAAGGTTALNAMLASCAQGITVTNIDNGFGAACAAARILSLER